MRLRLLLYIWWIIPAVALAGGQDTIDQAPVYFERIPNGMIRFFYDDNYYLADKYCQFKEIERVGQYDFSKRVFTGEFTDFDNWGRVMLQGNYRDGKKEGEFKAYHPNGHLKWEVTFAQDYPQGRWKFYYPDGKPVLELAYDTGEMLIYNFWDNRGRQRVERGSGRYELAVKADGYNESGYVRYNRKGRVVEGRPHGFWAVEYIFDNNKKTNAGHEYYQNGRFVNGYDAFQDEFFDDKPRYGLVPFDVFIRAEFLVSKPCNIDDYSGFTGFLGEHLEKWFAEAVDETPEALGPQQIAFQVTVNKNGEPRKVEAVTSFEDKAMASSLLDAFRWIRFWFPSYADDEYIDDVLTVTADVFLDATEGKLRFFDIHIQREKGI